MIRSCGILPQPGQPCASSAKRTTQSKHLSYGKDSQETDSDYGKGRAKIIQGTRPHAKRGKELNMVTEKPEAIRTQPEREYPTEWTWYGADQDEDTAGGHREEERGDPADTEISGLQDAT